MNEVATFNYIRSKRSIWILSFDPRADFVGVCKPTGDNQYLYAQLLELREIFALGFPDYLQRFFAVL